MVGRPRNVHSRDSPICRGIDEAAAPAASGEWRRGQGGLIAERFSPGAGRNGAVLRAPYQPLLRRFPLQRLLFVDEALTFLRTGRRLRNRVGGRRGAIDA